MWLYVATAHVISRRDRHPQQGRDSFSSRIVPRGLSVAEGPKTAPHNAAHLYRKEPRSTRLGIQQRLDPANSRLHGNQADPSIIKCYKRYIIGNVMKTHITL